MGFYMNGLIAFLLAVIAFAVAPRFMWGLVGLIFGLTVLAVVYLMLTKPGVF